MIIPHKRIGYDLNVMRQSACLLINPITVDNFDVLLLHADRSGVRLYDGPDLKLFILVGADRSSLAVALSTGAQLMIFYCFRFQWCCVTDQGSPSVMQQIVSVESSSLLIHSIEA